ncbi:hypothetical protein TcasGA2_TC016356 [Tribolium castaneum]|uniref:Uncharacterized protein n=1 Tax=Tribolium castaneum TaxID=7070 RepID=D6WPB5_TRICA|nr:hypothetical protein TcasGA2_TC016356 [Tribolium castaneum]
MCERIPIAGKSELPLFHWQIFNIEVPQVIHITVASPSFKLNNVKNAALSSKRNLIMIVIAVNIDNAPPVSTTAPGNSINLYDIPHAFRILQMKRLLEDFKDFHKQSFIDTGFGPELQQELE